MTKAGLPFCALTLCLSLSGCLATRYEFGGVGFRVIPSGLPLYQGEETVPEETEIPRTEYPFSPLTSAAIARYFDMQLGLDELPTPLCSAPLASSTPASTTRALLE